MDNPRIGSTIEIKSLKHDQKLHRQWKENIVLFADDHVVLGGNNQTIVEEAKGGIWRTTEPAIFYFDRRYWFNIILLKSERDFYYYCNLSSPFMYKDKTLQYIDYDIDIIVQSDFSYKIIDQNEFEENRAKFNYTEHISQSVMKGIAELERWISERKNPFNKNFFEHWYYEFINIRKI